MRPALGDTTVGWLDRAAPADVRAYASNLVLAAAAIAEVGRRLTQLVAGATGAGQWLGAAAAEAVNAHERQRRVLEESGALLHRVGRVLVDLAATLEASRIRRARAVAAAESCGLQLGAGPLQPQLCIEADVADLRRKVADAEATAVEADAAAARSLGALADEMRGIGLRPVGALALDLVALPDARLLSRAGVLGRGALPGATVVRDLRLLSGADEPLAVRAYLESLPVSRQRWLAATYPALIGGLDGAPPGLRYDANRRLMSAALAQARAAGDSTRVGTLVRLLSDPDRQFLYFDPRGDGEIVEVLGDLDQAEHVAVVVPGINNTLDDYAAHLADRAANVQHAAAALAPGAVATVAWLGYDAPGYLDAPLTGAAQVGSRRLTRAMRALLPRPGVTTTVIGHSYGSLVVGSALRRGMRVDNVVVAGSPGMGVGSAADLQLPTTTRLYALRAPFDEVSWSENFGRDPSDPRFGATRLATAGPIGAGPVGHSGYFDRGSESLRNIARVVVGDRAALSVRHAGPVEIAAGVASDAASAAARVDPLHHLFGRLEDPDLFRDITGDELEALLRAS